MVNIFGQKKKVINMKKEPPCNLSKNKHPYICNCIKCQSLRAFCTCSACITRRTKFSGKFVDDRDFSKYPSLQQLIDLEKG